MNLQLAKKGYVDKKTGCYANLRQNTVGNAFRIGILKDGCDKATLLIHGSHNSTLFCALVYVNWDTKGVHATVQNLYGQLLVRYTDEQEEHVIVDFVTTIYGTAFVTCTNRFYASWLDV